MSDRIASINLQNDPFQAEDLGPEWLSTGALGDDGDLVSLQVAARFAELAVQVAEKQAIEVAIEASTRKSWDLAAPIDQVAIDWDVKTDAGGKIINAFLGIDYHIGQESVSVFQEEHVDAALSAFDKALESGFNAEEALSAAIKAAESVNASITVGAALAKAPVEIVFGLGESVTGSN